MLPQPGHHLPLAAAARVDLAEPKLLAAAGVVSDRDDAGHLGGTQV